MKNRKCIDYIDYDIRGYFDKSVFKINKRA